MGVVHRAYDRELRREVALKSIDVARPDDLYHLKREFRLLADLVHPNLVRLYELLVDGGHAFFTMELLFGVDLHTFVTERRVGGQPTCDYRRLRSVARELASALTTVHAAGSLHRDVKTSNILVTPGGRVVLFDFGLGASLCSKQRTTERAGVLLGTRGYISPEQARGEALTAAADWYSFGVTLFEAATGYSPFGEPSVDHEAHSLTRISRYLPDVPPDLDDLIAELLDPTAIRRPSEADILRLLGGSSTPPGRSFSRPSRGQPTSERRRKEPELMTRVLDGVSRGQSAILHVHGGAGAGKSQLACDYTEEAKNLGAMVLSGCCRVQESVAFNAVDEIVDDLSQVLRQMPYGKLLSILPAQVTALAHLFPVLGRLETSFEGPFSRGSEDEGETLQRARGALKELLLGLANGRPLVIWIDDAQWGDRESGELLSELLQPGDAPPILLLLSYRSDEGPNRGMLEALRELSASTTSFDLVLERLAESNESPHARYCK